MLQHAGLKSAEAERVDFHVRPLADVAEAQPGELIGEADAIQGT
jgi:hypothetical protein